MNPEEQEACLKFAEEFGWLEWGEGNRKCVMHYTGDCGFEWRFCVNPDDYEHWIPFESWQARDRWIVWLIEEAKRFAGTKHVEICLSKATNRVTIFTDEFFRMDGEQDSFLLALLAAVGQAKQKKWKFRGPD